jgi:pyrroline-5-carboxylate reductase
MKIGLIGAGNMARALARGWQLPLLCSDPVSERAAGLAKEVGGQALDTNAEVAEQTDLVVLCHKPAQLEEVAAQIGLSAKAVVSILAGVPLSRLKRAYPDRPVYRFIPSLPVEVRKGAVVQAADEPQDEAFDREVHELFGRLGCVITVEDRLLDVATGLMSCAPAYVALIAEAQVDAGVRHGLHAEQAASLVVQTFAGTAELLRRRDYDTLAVRREVASPGGLTARGLAALERGGLRSAFDQALDSVLGC